MSQVSQVMDESAPLLLDNNQNLSRKGSSLQKKEVCLLCGKNLSEETEYYRHTQMSHKVSLHFFCSCVKNHYNEICPKSDCSQAITEESIERFHIHQSSFKDDHTAKKSSKLAKCCVIL